MFEPSEVERYRRQLAGMLRAAGSDDPEAVAAVAELLTWAAGEGMRGAVAALRAQDNGPAGGYSWAEIAAPFGITRQTAHERFSPRAGE